MPGRVEERWARVSDSVRRRVSFRAELQILCGPASARPRLVSLLNDTHLSDFCDPIYSIDVPFCSIPFPLASA